MILAYAGARYLDERLSGEEFGKLKPSLTYGQVPVLSYNGETICQSITIAR